MILFPRKIGDKLLLLKLSITLSYIQIIVANMERENDKRIMLLVKGHVEYWAIKNDRKS